MLAIQRRLSIWFLMLLALPATAVGFCLSSGIASMSWILSTRYHLNLDNIALIWLGGPLMGLIVQPLVGLMSDRTWFLGARRKPYLAFGGVMGAASIYALLELDRLAAATGLSVFVWAIIVALLSDMSINVTFNPARSLVADLTPEGAVRVRGYSWMQTVSGLFGISAYLISITLGNVRLVQISAVITFAFSVLPLFFIQEIKNNVAIDTLQSNQNTLQKRHHWRDLLNDLKGFKSLAPMSGFMLYGFFVAIDRVVLDNCLAAVYAPLFVAVVILAVVWGLFLIWRGRQQPTDSNRTSKILLANGFAWLGVQGMFLMSFFYVRDYVAPTTTAHTAFANSLIRLIEGSDPNAADTAGNILSMGFLVLNLVGAIFPVAVLNPLCQRFDKVRVHSAAIGSMVLGFLLVCLGSKNELAYYFGMLVCGIGWASMISIVFAIFSESVNSTRMGLNMGIFNASLVLPAISVPGLLKLSTELNNNYWMFVLLAASLAISCFFWCSVEKTKS